MPWSVCTTEATKMSQTCEEQFCGTELRRVAKETKLKGIWRIAPSQHQILVAKGHQRNRWSEDSSVVIHKLQIETVIQPRRRRFSSVGIFPCIVRQRIKEHEGGMHDLHIKAAQGRGIETGTRKFWANFEASLPSEEWSQTKTVSATRLDTAGSASKAAGNCTAPSTTTSATKVRNCLWRNGGMCNRSTKEIQG